MPKINSVPFIHKEWAVYFVTGVFKPSACLFHMQDNEIFIRHDVLVIVTNR